MVPFIVSLLVLSCAWGRAEQSLPFDSETWKEGYLIPEWDTVRRPMAPDLVRKGILLNKTKDEVIQLLGQPQSISPYSQPDEEKLLYSLGQIYSGDIYYLMVVLKNEIVIDVYIENT